MGGRDACEPCIAFHCARCGDDFAMGLVSMCSGRVVLCPVCLGTGLTLSGEDELGPIWPEEAGGAGGAGGAVRARGGGGWDDIDRPEPEWTIFNWSKIKL